jgi:hypothetical protein
MFAIVMGVNGSGAIGSGLGAPMLEEVPAVEPLSPRERALPIAREGLDRGHFFQH